MKGWRPFLSFFLCALSFFSLAQELTLVKSHPLKVNEKELHLDQFGNRFIILNNELRKLDTKGSFVASYSDPIQGNITSLDLLNPLNPLIYYRSSNLLRVLDNRLNNLREYNLSLNFQDPAFITAAAEGSIWIYNQNTDQIQRYSLLESRVINSSPIFSQALNDPESEVLQLSSSYDRVLVQLKSKGSYFLLVFDAQGALQRKLKLKDLPLAISHFNQRLLLLYENQLLELIDLGSFQRLSLLSPQAQTKQIFYFHPRLYLQTDNQLFEYRLSLP